MKGGDRRISGACRLATGGSGPVRDPVSRSKGEKDGAGLPTFSLVHTLDVGTHAHARKHTLLTVRLKNELWIIQDTI